MKKVLVFMLALALTAAFALIGCAQPAPAASSPAPEASSPTVESAPPAESSAAASTDTGAKKKIGVAMIDLVNPFYVNMVNAGNDAAKDFNVDVTWKSSDSSLEKEISLVENFIQQKVDCILMDPYDAKGVIPVVEEAGKAGIPIVTMGNFVDTQYNINTLYNDFNDTKRIAEILANLIDKKGKVALIFGNDGNFCSDQRKAGFMEGMKAFPDIQVIAQPSNWDSATGLKAAQDIIAANPDLKAIHVVSDGVTLSVLQAVKGTNIIVTSYDGNVEGSQAVKDGAIKLDLLTGSKRVGYWNVKIGAQLANGEKLDQKQYLKSYFIMNDDLKAKAQEWGLTDGINIVGPDEGIKLFDAYREDLGPGK